jgi:hypothetical protein
MKTYTKPTLFIELHDQEVAESMTFVSEEYHPGVKMFHEFAALEESEIDCAVNVLVPVL